jgi:hypothetical protein
MIYISVLFTLPSFPLYWIWLFLQIVATHECSVVSDQPFLLLLQRYLRAEMSVYSGWHMQQLDKGGEPSVRNCQTSFQPPQTVPNTVHIIRYIPHSVPFYHQMSTFIVIHRLSCSFGFIIHRIHSCFITLQYQHSSTYIHIHDNIKYMNP